MSLRWRFVTLFSAIVREREREGATTDVVGSEYVWQKETHTSRIVLNRPQQEEHTLSRNTNRQPFILHASFGRCVYVWHSWWNQVNELANEPQLTSMRRPPDQTKESCVKWILSHRLSSVRTQRSRKQQANKTTSNYDSDTCAHIRHTGFCIWIGRCYLVTTIASSYMCIHYSRSLHIHSHTSHTHIKHKHQHTFTKHKCIHIIYPLYKRLRWTIQIKTNVQTILFVLFSCMYLWAHKWFRCTVVEEFHAKRSFESSINKNSISNTCVINNDCFRNWRYIIIDFG